MHAARATNAEMVAAFLDAGIDPNRESAGTLALVQAISSTRFRGLIKRDEPDHRARRLETTRVLLERGADPHRPERGETPAEIAWFAGLPEITPPSRPTGVQAADARAADRGADPPGQSSR